MGKIEDYHVMDDDADDADTDEGGALQDGEDPGSNYAVPAINYEYPVDLQAHYL